MDRPGCFRMKARNAVRAGSYVAGFGVEDRRNSGVATDGYVASEAVGKLDAAQQNVDDLRHGYIWLRHAPCL